MSTSQRPLRKDAQRNRQLLVDAARQVFGEKGLDAPLDEIARTAGVAIGTLYNRFPSREELIDAAFAEQMRQSADIAEQALEFADPWSGFEFMMTRFCALQVSSRGFSEAHMRTFAADSAIELAKLRLVPGKAKVIARAHESGQLRADFGLQDAAGVVVAATQAGRNSGTTTEDNRLLRFLLDGLRAHAK